jgi:diacylglycerol kinase family enzyme
VRGLLIANPNATTTDVRTRDVLTAALSSVVELQAVTTTHRGHAGELAVEAVAAGLDVVVTLGGDGTVHEVVNGMLGTGSSVLPALAPIPGGSANVFARALGLPNNPVTSTGAILAALREDRFRRIGLGRANGLWFTINAGLGLDAEVIAAMERQRGDGRKATPTRYLSTAVRGFFVTDRKHPALTVLREDGPPINHAYLTIVQNCSPWTYLGTLPVNACPRASFETGLDVMAVRSMGVLQGLGVTGKLLRGNMAEVDTDALFIGHALDRFVIRSEREIELQVDGEAIGPTRHVTFESHPDALRVVDVR